MKNIFETLCKILIFITIIDPSNILKIKFLLFLLVIIFYLFFIKLNKMLLLKVTFFISSIIVYSFIVGILDDGYSGFLIALTIIKPLLYLMIIPVFSNSKFNCEEKLSKYSVFIAVFVLITAGVYYFIPSLFKYFYIFSEKKAMFISRRVYGGHIFNVFYYKTSILLTFPVAYYSKKLFEEKKKLFNVLIILICLSSIILSMSRANMIVNFLIFFYYFFRKIIKMKVGVLVLIPLVSYIIFSKINLVLEAFLDKKEQSNFIKMNSLNSYKELYSKIKVVLLGQGIGTEFYDYGRRSYMRYTELSYLEIFRMFGLFLGIILCAFLFYPIFKMIKYRKILKNKDYLILSYIGFLIIGGTNPLLINSTGCFTVSIIYSYIIKIKKEKKNENSCTLFPPILLNTDK